MCSKGPIWNVKIFIEIFCCKKTIYSKPLKSGNPSEHTLILFNGIVLGVAVSVALTPLTLKKVLYVIGLLFTIPIFAVVSCNFGAMGETLCVCFCECPENMKKISPKLEQKLGIECI